VVATVASVVRTRRSAAVLLALLVALALVSPAAAGKKGDGSVHRPPYKKGPSGGDEWNYVHSDPQAGQVAVVRTFPGFSPVVGCEPEPSAGWAMLRVPHHVNRRPRSVIANFEGALDPYSWLMVAARSPNGDWLALKKIQGPLAGSGKVKARFFRTPKRGSDITIEFGVQLGDSCPQVGVAAAEFPSIVVKS
jgi:hypothetical protein